MSEEERAAVEKGLRSSEAFVLRRSQILLASASGKRASQIAAAVGGDADTALNAINAFNEKGIAALTPGSSVPHQYKVAFDAEAAERLRALLHRSPREVRQWTLH